MDHTDGQAVLARLTEESIALGLYDFTIEVSPDDIQEIRRRVSGLVATAERRRTPGFTWRPGDRVLAYVQRDGRRRVENVAVLQAVALECGCTRLECELAAGSNPSVVYVRTGCEKHQREC
jgi:hypothetical protein